MTFEGFKSVKMAGVEMFNSANMWETLRVGVKEFKAGDKVELFLRNASPACPH
jgi:hypothetical protein